MRYFTLFILFLFSATVAAQENPPAQKVTGTIINDNTLLPISNANVININKVLGVITDTKGFFELEVSVNDTLHISLLGYQSLRVRVTNDWLKNGTAKLQLTEKAIALEEVIVKKYDLTGYLEIDTKLIPEKDNYRYSISGLPQGYETGSSSPGAFSRVLGSIFNPADMLYNFFGNKSNELEETKEDEEGRYGKASLESKFDRETLGVLLGVDKKEIAEILTRCSYSEDFIKTANDLQIMDAISECYEQYKVLSKKNEKYIHD